MKTAIDDEEKHPVKKVCIHCKREFWVAKDSDIQTCDECLASFFDRLGLNQ